MLTLPVEVLPLLVEFAPPFSEPVWEHATVLVVGAILATGKRTVTACLRVMGLSQEQGFVNYHCVLHRARWSALAESRHMTLILRVALYAPTPPAMGDPCGAHPNSPTVYWREF